MNAMKQPHPTRTEVFEVVLAAVAFISFFYTLAIFLI